MTRYRYRCTYCRTTSPPVETRAELRRERQLHRDLAHGGHAPDGERIWYVGSGSGRERADWRVLGWIGLVFAAAAISWVRAHW